MPWEQAQDRHLLAHYSALIAIRRAHRALRGGARASLPVAIASSDVETARQVGAYLRWLDGDVVLVVLNNAERPCQASIAIGDHPVGRHLIGGRSAGLRGLVGGRSRGLRDLLAPSGESEIRLRGGAIELKLPALSACRAGGKRTVRLRPARRRRRAGPAERTSRARRTRLWPPGPEARCKGARPVDRSTGHDVVVPAHLNLGDCEGAGGRACPLGSTGTGPPSSSA